MNHQVFLSHSTKDKQVVDAVCHALENSGIRCWIAPRDIAAGEPWEVAIEEAIETCEVFVLVFSEHVNNSEGVRNEIFLATNENKLIIPFKIDDSSWGKGLKSLGRLHWLDAYPNWETQFESLANQVKRNLSVETKPIEQSIRKPISVETSRVVSVQDTGQVTKPSWAETTGRDQYGQYADLVFKGVWQRFRYVEAGEFMMGSPEDEPERKNRETQHKVRLTESYWMADRACTQEMWMAVLGENPSSFKGDDLPVEQVSWEDINNSFLSILRRQTDNELFRLPTEAEWEYACRAGTVTPFSFGNNITSEQVNFDGEEPYNSNPKSFYRGRTIPVVSLPCNDWGLYEMHGNVWEWCEDWFGGYQKQEAINPIGPNTGEIRVLRGGSWYDSGRDCRSAFRYNDFPSDRRYNVGFRLISGHSAEPS